MDDEFNSGLSVNFTTAHVRRKPRTNAESPRLPTESNRPRNQPSTGNRSDNDIVNELSDKNSSNSTQHRKDRNDRERHRGRSEFTGPPTHGIISSLFRKNPEIPTMEKKKVKQVKEELFSSDDFCSVGLHPYMVSNLEKLGFTKLTAVQRETMPKIMNGHDVLVKSQTGSGKTMAYAIPIIEDLASLQPKIKRQDGILAVILVPTRELAVQSFDVFQKLLKPFIWVVPGCLMGGEQRKAEKARLRKGVNVLISTPGRMIDHMQNTANMELHNVRWLVLDEADRLLDMGFEAQVAKIVSSIDNKDRQSVLLSATLTESVERLASVSLKNPQKIAINENNQSKVKSETKKEPGCSLQTLNQEADTGSVTGSNPASDIVALPESLKQYFVIVPCKLRLVSLLCLLLSKCKKTSKMKMIVFMSTQDSVEFMYRLVQFLSIDHQSSDIEDEEDAAPETSLNLFRLHGDMSQKDRTSAYQDFCKTSTGVLFCTDVAARGLHLPSVQWVIQYTCPAGSKDYVHRAGRTARAGFAGTSLMFLLPSEVKFVEYLGSQNISLTEMKSKKLLSDVMKIIDTLPGLEDSQRELPKNDEEAAMYLQFCTENYIRQNKDMGVLSKKAFQSCVRAYATYPSQLKYIFLVKNLHLGHMAKTFGLRDAPSDITGVPGLQQRKKPDSRKRKFHWDEEDFERTDVRKQKPREISEFGGAPVYKGSLKKPKKMQKKMLKGKKFKQKT